MKKFLRYLKETRNHCLVMQVPDSERFSATEARPIQITVTSDSDWSSPKSTSAGIVFLGTGKWVAHSHSRTQPVISLSTGEAGLIAASTAVAESRLFGSLLEELAIPFTTELLVDSTASMGMINRMGVGRVKHLSIRWLWIQEMSKSGKLKVSKVLTTDNTSDIGTKYLPVALHQQHTEGLGVHPQERIFPDVPGCPDVAHVDWAR